MFVSSNNNLGKVLLIFNNPVAVIASPFKVPVTSLPAPKSVLPGMLTPPVASILNRFAEFVVSLTLKLPLSF